MAWYDEKDRVSYIGIYKNDKDMRKELEQAIRRGWKLQDTTTDGGHLNLGRTATGAVLTGGLSLLIGGSRSKGGHTLVFVRDEAYIAKQRLEQSIVSAKGFYERLATAELEEDAAAAVFVSRWAEIRGFAGLLRERGEKGLREALQELSKRRSAAIIARDQFLSAGLVVKDCRAAASSLGETVVDDMLRNVDRLEALAETQVRRRALVDTEKSALPSLLTVETRAKDYFRAHERVRDFDGKRDAAGRNVEAARNALAAAAPGKVSGLERRLEDAKKELSKRESELSSAEAALANCADTLTSAMGSRDVAMSAIPVNADRGG